VRQALDFRTQAVRHYEKALRIGSDNPGFPLIWVEEAKIFMDAGYYEQALYYLEKGAAAFPNRPDVLYSIGVCYFNLRQYNTAIPYFQRVVQAQPSIELWGMLAKAYEETGENYSAIQIYDRALSQYPQSAEIHYNLGVLYHRIGDSDQAVEHLEQALRVAPTGPLAGNIEKMLEIIREDS
ncbi:MAG: tetratricopeptide repeat protein, partial [Acidobacteria bacterium]